MSLQGKNALVTGGSRGIGPYSWTFFPHEVIFVK